jgi:uncharacterized damage-inducible protein DinB
MNVRLLRTVIAISLAMLACGSVAVCQQTNAAKPKTLPNIALTMDALLTVREQQIIPAAEAMPEEKYSFVPEGEDFKGSRTFALEVRHVAAVNFGFFSLILGQSPPPGVSYAGSPNGPDDLQTKEQIMQFLKDSFALGHKAIASITENNALTSINNPNLLVLPPHLRSRLALASLACAHVSNHYGQMAVYLRMNGITPPASVGSQPANPQSRQTVTPVVNAAF